MSYYEQADKQIVKAIQGVTGARVDGYFGEQSLFNMFLKLCNVDKYLPVCTDMFGGHLIMASKNQVHFAEVKNREATKNFDYAVSGTFQNGRTNELVSIMVNDGKVLHATGSKVWKDKAEGTIYMTTDGTLHWNRLKNINLVEDVKWAISGVSVHNYHPVWEGFSGASADVLRYTGHILFGVTQDDKIVAFYKKTSMGDIKYISDKILKLKYSISLDGGHIASINTPEYHYNNYQRQNNLIWFGE